MLTKKSTAPLFMSLLLITACSGQTTTTAPSDIHFETLPTTINKTPFTLEVADTDAKRERGLMFRESMPADHGMIFIFDTADNYRFWMKNTYIPLDILFLDSAGKIIIIQPRKPRDLTSDGPDTPALYVVELNKDAAAKLNLHVGDTFPLPDKLLKPTLHTDEK